MKAKRLLSLALFPLTDRPNSSERKAMVDQVTDPSVSSRKNLVQMLSTLLSHRLRSLVLWMHMCSKHQRACATLISQSHPSNQQMGIMYATCYNVPRSALEVRHACIMETCRNFDGVICLCGNFRVEQQRMGRTQ